jgi:alanine or glycine:cation symporter, AGCS family
VDFVTDSFGYITDLIGGWASIPILIVSGVFITVMSRCVQLEFFTRMFRVVSSRNQSGDASAISACEALLISVGGRVGGGEALGVNPTSSSLMLPCYALDTWRVTS